MSNQLAIAWSRSRTTIIACLAGMLAAGSLVAVAYQRFERDERRVADDSRSERQARRRLAELNDDMVAAGISRNEFMTLKSEGVLGDLDKPRLLDGIETGLSRFGIAVREYKLEARREYSNPALAVLQRHQFGQHRLELLFSPVHEGEFLDIWDTLRRSRNGIAPIESCEIKRKESDQSTQSSESVPTGRLEARCVLVAYSIRSESTTPALASTAAMAQTAAPLAPTGRR